MSPDKRPPPLTRPGEDSERQNQQLPPRLQARNSPGQTRTNGDAYGFAYHQPDQQPVHASGFAPREGTSHASAERPVVLPGIEHMFEKPPGPPNGATPTPPSFGLGPPTSYLSNTKPAPRVFADPARPALGNRVPPPRPLEIPAAQHIPTTNTGHHASRPPSRGSYTTSAQLPPASYAVSSSSPRHPPPQPSPLHPPLATYDLISRYEPVGNPGPVYNNVALGPAPGSASGHDRVDRPADRGFASWDYDENLDRIKTYSHSISHFAESYIRAAREQNGVHPIQSRLPSDGEIKQMLDHAAIITNCLGHISGMVAEAHPSMGTDRADRPAERKEQPIAAYAHQQPLPTMPTTRQLPQSLPEHHALQPQMPPPPPMTPHTQHPRQHTYSLAEHKHNNNKRRGTSLDSPPRRGSGPRYADPPPRKRAAPPGRCHSCNRVDTPEWRRGPDGARTLCNACGLHYAKLERKKASEMKNIRPRPSTTT